jgi:hypothetical protein
MMLLSCTVASRVIHQFWYLLLQALREATLGTVEMGITRRNGILNSYPSLRDPFPILTVIL